MTALSPARLFFGLLLWLLFTSWLPQRIFLAVFEAGIFGLVAHNLWKSDGAGRPRNLPMLLIPMLLIVTLPGFGLLQLVSGQAAYPWATATSTLDWGALAGTAWLAARLSEAPEFESTFQRVLVGTGLVVAVLGALHWYSSPGYILWTFVNPYQLLTTFPLLNHTHFAAFIELALAPAAWTAMRARRLNAAPSQIPLWITAILVCGVWASGSRSGSAVVTLELAGVILLSGRGMPVRAGYWRRARGVLLPAVVLVAGIGWQGLAARLALPLDDDLRPAFARSAIEMVKARPALGFGLGSFATVYPAFESIDLNLRVEHAHNDWLEWAAEGGVPFAAVCLALALLAARCALRSPWYFGVVAVLVQASIDFPLHKPAVAAWLLATGGCMTGSCRAERKPSVL